jgi:hypothetical protein
MRRCRWIRLSQPMFSQAMSHSHSLLHFPTKGCPPYKYWSPRRFTYNSAFDFAFYSVCNHGLRSFLSATVSMCYIRLYFSLAHSNLSHFFHLSLAYGRALSEAYDKAHRQNRRLTTSIYSNISPELTTTARGIIIWDRESRGHSHCSTQTSNSPYHTEGDV